MYLSVLNNVPFGTNILYTFGLINIYSAPERRLLARLPAVFLVGLVFRGSSGVAEASAQTLRKQGGQAGSAYRNFFIIKKLGFYLELGLWDLVL